MFRAKSVKHDHRTKIARVDQQILSASVTYINRGVNTIGALYKSHVQRHNSTKHILKIGQWKKFRISCLACQMML
jgi:hypothetical protein